MSKEEPKKFICQECYEENVMNLPDNDARKIKYKQSSEYQRYLVKCVICEIEHPRFNYVEGAEDFCCWEHQITQIQHYTEIGKLSSYKLNKSAILRTVASEYDTWNEQDQYSFQNVIDNIILTLQQRNDKERLKKFIIESFDISSNIDIELVINRLFDNFGGNLQEISFCRECFIVVKNAQNSLCGYCVNYDKGSVEITNNEILDKDKINRLENQKKHEKYKSQISNYKKEEKSASEFIEFYKNSWLDGVKKGISRGNSAFSIVGGIVGGLIAADVGYSSIGTAKEMYTSETTERMIHEAYRK
ncbi:8021_t:CDS:2 [Cetraspora pellucida]|uniref:8021_t:CDS:1 n=1 Tax=Cetraspora pellucida TaxID=1433469 RepID=A0ACA9LPW3_9GLOM|nr:8021_t:CDS:2 [Cetraspora pellucida]